MAYLMALLYKKPRSKDILSLRDFLYSVLLATRN